MIWRKGLTSISYEQYFPVEINSRGFHVIVFFSQLENQGGIGLSIMVATSWGSAGVKQYLIDPAGAACWRDRTRAGRATWPARRTVWRRPGRPGRRAAAPTRWTRPAPPRRGCGAWCKRRPTAASPVRRSSRNAPVSTGCNGDASGCAGTSDPGLHVVWRPNRRAATASWPEVPTSHPPTFPSWSIVSSRFAPTSRRHFVRMANPNSPHVTFQYRF